MAKQKHPDSIQKQFNKIQYKPGEAVFFTWLGCKKYGYVIRTKETNWGIQYTIDSEGTKYPCGIQIKTHKTTYTTGCINHDETRALGQRELITRIQTGHPSTYSELFIDARRTEVQSTSKSGTSKRILVQNSKRVKSTGSDNPTTNAIQSSINGDTSRNGKKRKNSGIWRLRC